MTFTLADQPLLLDGGLASELVDHGVEVSGALWSARLLADDPAAVIAAHRAFFTAGARIAISASYQASVAGFGRAGYDEAAARGLMGRSVELARQAAVELGCDDVERWVAASVGPHAASLSGGAEYRPGPAVGRAELIDFHGPRLEALAAAGPDLVAVETIGDLAEAAVVIELLDSYRLPAWISFTPLAGRTRAGQPLSEAFELAASSPQVLAVGVNCCPPADVLDALRLVRDTGKPGIAYPNGLDWNSATGAWTGRRGRLAELAPSWIDAGAAFIGGCCGTVSADIAQLAAVLAPNSSDGLET